VLDHLDFSISFISTTMYSGNEVRRPPRPPPPRNQGILSSQHNTNKPPRFNNNNRSRGYSETVGEVDSAHWKRGRQERRQMQQRNDPHVAISSSTSNQDTDTNLQTHSSTGSQFQNDNNNNKHQYIQAQQQQQYQNTPSKTNSWSSKSSHQYQEHQKQEHQIQQQQEHRKKVIIILKTKPKEKRRFVVPVNITWGQFLRGVSERLRIVHVKAIYDHHNVEICTPEDIFDGETLYIVPYTKKEEDTRKIARQHKHNKNIGLTTYFNNLDQESTLPGGKKLVKPPIPKDKLPEQLKKRLKQEEEEYRKAKQHIAVGLNTYFGNKEEEGDLKQGRQYIPAPRSKPPKPTGVKFPIETGSYERWKELNPQNLPDDSKPRGPKIVENHGVWKLSGREPKSRLPSGYDPQHKLGKKHYWNNRHRFHDGRHAVQTLVGQMLDWTKGKHKLWHKNLHKKHLMDTQFFEKKKFIDARSRQRNSKAQQQQHMRHNVFESRNNKMVNDDDHDYKRNYQYLGKQEGGQNIIRVRSKQNTNNASNQHNISNDKANVARRPSVPNRRPHHYSSRNNSNTGRKHYLRKKRLGGVVQV
jgi:hypothetical protein